jgi:peptidoglycan/xylan/chitin deacetylase (PgdA/CDA1 family)
VSRAVAGAAAALAGTATRLPRKVTERRLRERCARDGLLALTYDDGPGERLTPRLLDLLAGFDAKATFYVLGSRASAAPAILDRVIAEGHEVGCHGFDHVNALRVPRAVATSDVERGYAALTRWVDRDAAFRPPYGKLRPATWRLARRRGAALGWWTVDSGDSLLAPPDLEAVVATVRRERGGVVLLHDFDRGEADREREEFTLATTAALLELARERGWTVTTQSALA